MTQATFTPDELLAIKELSDRIAAIERHLEVPTYGQITTELETSLVGTFAPDQHDNANHSTDFAPDQHDNANHSTDFAPTPHDNAHHSGAGFAAASHTNAAHTGVSANPHTNSDHTGVAPSPHASSHHTDTYATIVSGSYVGNGGTTARQITLGFAPKQVTLYNETSGNTIYISISTAGSIRLSDSGEVQTELDVYLHATNGFVVADGSTAGNDNLETYRYVAIT